MKPVEAAAQLQIPLSTVQRLCRTHGLGVLRDGRRVLRAGDLKKLKTAWQGRVGAPAKIDLKKVGQLRAAGHTWREVAAELGVTTKAAHDAGKRAGLVGERA